MTIGNNLCGTLPFVEAPNRREWVTSKLLRSSPIHRWFVFPHSFSDQLVENLIKSWQLSENDVLLDPFAGAGTTLLAGQQHGIPTVGVDLLPLAILVSRAKTRPPRAEQLNKARGWLADAARMSPQALAEPKSAVLGEAFTLDELAVLRNVRRTIQMVCRHDSALHDALLLALLGSLPRFSRLVSKGGWLAKTADPLPIERLPEELDTKLATMVDDLESRAPSAAAAALVRADARSLPLGSAEVSAVITSPPYPNRHDYTRVFGIELLFEFLDDGDIKGLRRQSLYSHPEARPKRPMHSDYRPPAAVEESLQEIASLVNDNRVAWMLTGYFADMDCVLRELHRVLKPGGRAALVLGNVRYCGVTVEIDIATCELACQVGFHILEICVARQRGNSAQQMSQFGRKPARECIVTLMKPEA